MNHHEWEIKLDVEGLPRTDDGSLVPKGTLAIEDVSRYPELGDKVAHNEGASEDGCRCEVACSIEKGLSQVESASNVREEAQSLSVCEIPCVGYIPALPVLLNKLPDCLLSLGEGELSTTLFRCTSGSSGQRRSFTFSWCRLLGTDGLHGQRSCNTSCESLWTT